MKRQKSQLLPGLNAEVLVYIMRNTTGNDAHEGCGV